MGDGNALSLLTPNSRPVLALVSIIALREQHAPHQKFKEAAMTNYTVGLKTGTHNRALTIEAEDALVAALKSKLENPEAQITYVRKANQRGDRRHPHEGLQARKTA